MKNNKKEVNYEYLRGILESRGCFTFCSIGFSGEKKLKIPTFTVAVSSENKNLLLTLKDKLGLKNRIYEYKPRIMNNGSERDGMAILMVRDFGQLKNVIIPFFYKKLIGRKEKQFSQWIEKIGNDPDVPKNYKFIYKIYKTGFYEKNGSFD